jgi:DNA-binding protein HU-beta
VTKQEFVDQIASKTDLSRKDAEKAVDAFLEAVSDTLKKGEDVTFTGFGKFSTHRRGARTGVNPRGTRRLDRAAAELREEADELERSQSEFRVKLERSRETLREIATA